MSYSSKHHSKSQLIEVLEKRGVQVDDDTILDKVNYSHLMYKYGKHYLIEENPEPKYKSATKLSHIYNLFLFNLELSSILYKAIHLVEHNMRSVIAHKLSNNNPVAYLKSSFYSSYDNKDNEVEKFVININQTEKYVRNKYDSKHYGKNGRLPLWLIIDELPMGQLRMIMKLKGIQRHVLKEFKISRKNSKNLVMVHAWRNEISHMGSLSKEIKNRNQIYSLKDLILFIRKVSPKHDAEIKNFINNYDFRNVNLSKEQLIKKYT